MGPSEVSKLQLTNERYDWILAEIRAEFLRASSKYPSFNSPHEGYAVLLEEVDELWDLVKAQTSEHDRTAMRAEARQVAAMALRFIVDLT